MAAILKNNSLQQHSGKQKYIQNTKHKRTMNTFIFGIMSLVQHFELGTTNYENEVVHLIFCGLDFELARVGSELSQHCQLTML